MRGNFPAALSAVLKHEGGYVDHPSDPGGATNMGITRKTLARWRNVSPWWELPKSEVKNIGRTEVAAIYKDRYWDDIRGDHLPSGVDLAVFDFAVNSGPQRAAISLQNIVGTAPDGEIGPLTLDALKKLPPTSVISDLCSQRLAFLERLSTWPTFGKGWHSRVSAVRNEAIAMVGRAAPVEPVPAKPAAIPVVPLPAPKPKGKLALKTIAIAVVILALIGASFIWRF